MANRPSTPEIITVNSEALQTQIRELLPSQSGFGSELQASNVITPIIDLTAAAEGSGLSADLQRAQAFGSQTSFNITNTTTTLANSPGFWQIQGNLFINAAGTTSFNITDGLSTKLLYNYVVASGANGENIPFSYVIWLAAGESVNFTVNSTAVAYGSYRQIADSQGSLVQPSGYPL
jgi:hypothetical protein